MAKSSFFSGTGTTSNDVDSVTSSKAAAAASATNAATSETNAAASASSASTSATNASTSATNASNSATAAATSETNAASSETNAATSETNAATSETNAATSATNAATSETNAATSATNAATSEANASTSATSAATSAASVGTQATDAAASATAAATSETNAATSETNAATSETNAATSETNASTSETNAAASATSASTDAATASTAATNASTSATSASTSATNAASSATAAAASQTAAAASAASAATAYDTFDDRYLGSKTADPTVDNDGNALVAGALYFNSSANEMRVYDGANWIAATSAGNASLLEYKYTATSGQTTFSGTDDSSNTLSYTQDNLIVTLNGVMLENGTDYTATTGTSVVLSSGAAANDELNVIAFKSFTTADMVSSANGGTFYNDVTISGNLDTQGTVTADGLTVDGNGSLLTLDNGSNPATLSNTNGNVTLDFDTTNTGRSFNIEENGNKAFRINNNGDISFYEDTGTTAKFFWDASAESLGIGTTSPSKKAHLYASNDSASLRLENTANSKVWDITPARPGVANTGLSIHNVTDNRTDLHIDSSGNVGIGTSSPSEDLDVSGTARANAFYVDGGSNRYIYITSSDGLGECELRLGDATDTDAGAIAYDNATNSMQFRAGAAERMRIDSSGNLLVGKTSTALGLAGVVAYGGSGAGVIGMTSATRPLYINKLTSDGGIIELAKDGTTVGSIGSRSGSQLYIEGEDGGIQLYQNGIRPNRNGALSDATQSIGTSGYRWTDLYLSGGVYLGGTGSSNKLDDYEEGTFTPTFVGSTGGTVTLGSAFDKYAYTKIGRMVTITGRVDVSGTPSLSGNLLLQGLPFTSGNLTDQAGYTVQYGFITIGASNTGNPIVIELQENTTEAALRLEDWTTAAGVLTNNSRIQMSITYFTT